MMPKSNINERLFDAMTLHSVNLEKVKLSTVKKIMREYVKLRNGLVSVVAAADVTGVENLTFQQRRAIKLFRRADSVVNSAYRKIKSNVQLELFDVADLESTFAINALNKAVGVEIASAALSVPFMKQIVDDTMIAGGTTAEYWAAQEAGTFLKFKQTIRQGMLAGDPLQKMIQAVRGTRANGYADGFLNVPMHQAEAVVRTTIQSVSNRAAEAMYKQNDDVLDGYIWSSTLDNRTTDVCIARDGFRYNFEFEPIDGGPPWMEGPGAIHWNCRSKAMPIISDFEDMPPEIQKRMNAAGVRQSQFGPVPKDLKYEQWLKLQEKKTPGFADDVLGKTRARLWRKKEIGIRDLMNGDGKPLSVAELKQKYRSEFKKGG